MPEWYRHVSPNTVLLANDRTAITLSLPLRTKHSVLRHASAAIHNAGINAVYVKLELSSTIATAGVAESVVLVEGWLRSFAVWPGGGTTGAAYTNPTLEWNGTISLGQDIVGGIRGRVEQWFLRSTWWEQSGGTPNASISATMSDDVP